MSLKIKRQKKRRQPHRYRCHYLASGYSYKLLNSELINTDELDEIPNSTFEGIVGKSIKVKESTPEEYIARLNKLFGTKDKTPVLTERLALNVSTLASCLQLNDTAADIIQFTAVMTLNKSLFELVNSYVYYQIDSMAHLLSVLLDIDELSIEAALEDIWSTGLLISSRLSADEPLILPSAITRKLVMDKISNSTEILDDILVKASSPELTLKHFDYLDISLAQQYLSAAIAAKETGVNVLFYGAPGTGKTQLTKILANEIGSELLEIMPVGNDLWSKQNEYETTQTSGALRLQFNQLIQKLLANTDKNLLLIDECEDLFAYINGEDRISKDSLHRLLETNTLPTIWITNHVNYLDESCLRRFKMILEFPKPSSASIKTLIDGSLKGLATSDDFRKELASTKHLTMANIDNAACVVKQVGFRRKDAEQHLNTLIESTLTACGYKHEVKYQAALKFNLNYLNLSGDFSDITKLIEATKSYSSARTLLTGMSGAGKTALVNHLAQTLDLELITVRCSDILSKYVGESEQKVAEVFKQATESEAILFFDEVDSLLASREGMNNGHEVQLVNELLTQIECFEFPLFAATNFSTRLDKAVMRRFDFKLHFQPLTTKQVKALFCETINGETVVCNANASKNITDKIITKEVNKQLDKLTMLTPGDFAIIKRRNQFSATPMSPQQALDILITENKRKTPPKPIGFINKNQ